MIAQHTWCVHASTHYTAVTALGIVCAHQCMHVKQWDRPTAIRTSISGEIEAISTAYNRYIPSIYCLYSYIYTLSSAYSLYTYLHTPGALGGGGWGQWDHIHPPTPCYIRAPTHPPTPLLHSCAHLPPPTPWIRISLRPLTSS